MTDIVVTGASGMLGRDLVQSLSASRTCVALTRSQLDVTNRNHVFDRLVRIHPAAIVNCSAYSNVDGCETNRETARSVNAMGPRFLAEAALQLDAFLIHLSTDYVFDGSKAPPQAYFEEDAPSPVNTYGRTKLEGEQFVRMTTPKHLIVRSAWLYGRSGRSFPRSVLRQVTQGKTLRVVNDQFGSPTWSQTLASQICALIEMNVKGTVHATAHGHCTWYDFAKEFLQYMDIQAKLTPCATCDYPRPASRPPNSILDNRRLRILGQDCMRHWREDLERFVKEQGSNLHKETLVS